MGAKTCGLPVSPTDRPGRTGCEAARFDVLEATPSPRVNSHAERPELTRLRDNKLFTSERPLRMMLVAMELDDELRNLLSGGGDDDGAREEAITAALKLRLVTARQPRKPGANKPRKTMMPIAGVRGLPERIARLVRWHYSLALRELEGGAPDARIGRVLKKIEAELERSRRPAFDSAPIKNISRVKKSDYTLVELRRAAQVLIELLTPLANGQPPGREEQAALDAGLRGFGLTPREAWIVVVLGEIEKARRPLCRDVPLDGMAPERKAGALLESLRGELGAELPPHVDLGLLSSILRTYAFHSGGGARDRITGRRRAVEVLRGRSR